MTYGGIHVRCVCGYIVLYGEDGERYALRGCGTISSQSNGDRADCAWPACAKVPLGRAKLMDFVDFPQNPLALGRVAHFHYKMNYVLMIW